MSLYGYAVGNNLEVIEAIKALKGDMPDDVKNVVLELGAYMIKLAGVNGNIRENKKRILENIENGKAYDKFIELVKNQGGDISYIKDTEKFKKAKYEIPVICDKDGYVEYIDAKLIGEISNALGAGRTKKEDSIDHTVGIVLCKKVSNKVKKGDTLAYIYTNIKEYANNWIFLVSIAYRICKNKVEKPKTILGIIK